MPIHKNPVAGTVSFDNNITPHDEDCTNLQELGDCIVAELNPGVSTIFFEDLLADSGQGKFGTTNGGNGSAWAYENLFELGHPGVSRGTTGAVSATTYCSLYAGRVLVEGEFIFRASIKIDTLASVAEDYNLICGLCDSVTGTATQSAISLEYNRAESLNWLKVTTAASSPTRTPSSIPVAAGAWIELKFVVDSTRSSVEYFIDGVSIGSVAATIPANSVTMRPMFKLRKTAGTTARLVYADYMYFKMYTSRGA